MEMLQGITSGSGNTVPLVILNSKNRNTLSNRVGVSFYYKKGYGVCQAFMSVHNISSFFASPGLLLLIDTPAVPV